MRSPDEYYYQPTDDGFKVVNGVNILNRPLFCPNSPSKVFVGDLPIITISLMAKGGKAGNLRIGVVTKNGALWLDKAKYCEATYCLGTMRYRIRDPLFEKGEIELEIAPEIEFTGFVVRIVWHGVCPNAKLIWVFGGNSGSYSYKNCYAHEVLLFNAEDCEGNNVSVSTKGFRIFSKRVNWDRDGIIICEEPSKTLNLDVEVKGYCDTPGEYRVVDAAFFNGPCVVPISVNNSVTPIVAFVSDPLLTTGESFIAISVNHSVLGNPEDTYTKSVAFWKRQRNLIELETPESDLDLVFRNVLCEIAGCYSGDAFYHGNFTWMGHYLGWRVLYGPILCGMIEEVKEHTWNHIANQITEGSEAGFMNPLLEWRRNIAFNMGEVHTHHMAFLYRWTRDVDFLSEIFDSLALYLDWQKRYLDTDKSGLYENILNTWISDGHWHLGGASVQSSAYMYAAHRLMAEVARRTGREAKPWIDRAALILDQMKKLLWLSDRGLYADYVDRMGEGLIHAEPELATIYHPEECETLEELELRQSCEWVTRTLKHHHISCTNGVIYWSSRWTPDRGGDYVHTTTELSPSENIHFALSLYRSGMSELAHKVLRGAMAEMFLYGSPGSTSCKVATSGAMRGCVGFGDTPGMFVRTVIEGLFGMRPRLEKSCLDIQPHLPIAWEHARVKTPYVGLMYCRKGKVERYEVLDAKFNAVVFRLINPRGIPTGLKIDGVFAPITFVEGIDAPTIEVSLTGGSHTVEVEIGKKAWNVPERLIVATDEKFRLETKIEILECLDPQGAFASFSITKDALDAIITNTPGEKTAFLRVRSDNATFSITLPLSIRYAVVASDCVVDCNNKTVRFNLVNQLDKCLTFDVNGEAFGEPIKHKVRLMPGTKEKVELTIKNREVLLPGHIEFALELKGDITMTVPVCFLVESDLRKLNVQYWTVPLECNIEFERMMDNTFTSSTPQFDRNKWYYDSWYTGKLKCPYNGTLLHEAIKDGIFISRFGIPFLSNANGPNCIAITRWNEFPTEVTIPVGYSGDKMYVMLAGVTSPMQCYVTNVRLTIEYIDGETLVKKLVNPYTFDSMGGTRFGAYHISDNLHEIIGTVQKSTGDTVNDGVTLLIPPHEPDKGTHADIIDIDIDRERIVKELRVRAVANEIVCAIFGVTIVRNMATIPQRGRP